MKNDKVQQIAMVCHEANRAYCASQGDLSQPAWIDAPTWMRESVVDGVLFQIGNLAAKKGTSPEESHNNWLRHKKKDGWVWGAVKDAGLRTHPGMVAYHELTKEQRTHDHIFIGIVEAFWNASVEGTSSAATA